MIKSIHISNFKSLVDFRLPPGRFGASPLRQPVLSQFTCLIGLNGTGKSTVLQALDFLCHLVTGDVEEWLRSREWKASDLISSGSKSPVIEFQLIFGDTNHEAIAWTGRFNISHMRCTLETIYRLKEVSPLWFPVFSLSDRRIRIKHSLLDKGTTADLQFNYQGSVLSHYAPPSDAPPEIHQVKAEMAGLRSLELLSPHLIRKRARKAEDIGVGGEKLSAFLATLKTDQIQAFVEMMQQFYPGLRDVSVTSVKAGWKSLKVIESALEGRSIDAAHMNDGLLRIMAIVSQAQSKHSVLLFDEIENGINPELARQLVDFLLKLDKQVIVTTHSPLILNYIPDETARKSVFFLYKGVKGSSRCHPFFDLPETREKLEALGPGEVFADTSLTELSRRLALQDAQDAQDAQKQVQAL